MKLGIAINETWAFFDEVYADLSEHHETALYRAKKVNPPFFRERLNGYLLARGLRAFLRANDVVFFEWASDLLAAATHFPKTCGIITRLHRYEMYERADQICWETVDRIILVSQAKQREFLARFPGQASKVVVIPEAISLDKFRTHQKPFKGDIGVLCHLTPRKRVYELILAFHELTRQRRDLHLHIGGGMRPPFADYYEALQALVKRLNLQDRVTFYGHVADPVHWYRRIDVFVSNSYSEGLQVSPMEAIASGCYCLSHWWDGADELLPQDNLFYTDPELIRKLVEYCDAPEHERQARCARLQAMVRNKFDVDQTKVRIRQLVEEVAASRLQTLEGAPKPR